MDGSWHRFARLGPTLCVGLAACGPRHSDEPCREGLVDSAVIIRDEADIAALPRVNAIVSLEIADTDLEDLSGLECVEFVESLTIRGNRRLQDLAGLDSLQAVRTRACFGEDPGDDCKENQFPPENYPPGVAELRIDDNDALESLQGLGSLMYVAGSMRVRRNPQLRSLEGLSSLYWVGVPQSRWRSDAEFEVADNARLETVAGIEAIDGWALWIMNLTLRSNPLLDSLATGGNDRQGFSVGVLGIVKLEDLPSLASVEELSTWLVGGLDLRSLALVTELPAALFSVELANAEQQLWKGVRLRKLQLVLLDNPSLGSLAGFAAVGSLDGPLIVGRNPLLTTLAGLDSLEELGGAANIERASLGELGEESLAIFGNLKLAELDALDSESGGGLKRIYGEHGMIRENPVLPKCQAEGLAARFPEIEWSIEESGGPACR